MVLEILATGNELLDGSISDTNSQRLAALLSPHGLAIQRISTIRDQESDLLRALKQASERADVVLISGGMGPTTDDLTLDLLSKFSKQPLVEHPAAKQNVLRRLKKLNRTEIREGHRRQFLVPKGAQVLKNSEGTAPGLCLKLKSKLIFALPGVPREFDAIAEGSVVPMLVKKFRGKTEPTHLFVSKVFGIPESGLQEIVQSVKWPREVVSFGYRTHLPENHAKFLVKAKTRALAKKKISRSLSIFTQKLGSAYFANDDQSFAEAFVSEMKAAGKRLVVAESCTGGLIASMVTSVSGSSSIFDFGVVTYSNQSKQDLLGVSPEVIERFGAVSEECVVAMAEGLLQKSEADFAVAVSGVAGPSGGTREKPVGLIWFALATRSEIRVHSVSRDFGRALNQKFAAYQAIQMVREALL